MRVRLLFPSRSRGRCVQRYSSVLALMLLKLMVVTKNIKKTNPKHAITLPFIPSNKQLINSCCNFCTQTATVGTDCGVQVIPVTRGSFSFALYKVPITVVHKQ